MQIPHEAILLRIFIGETDSYKGKALYEQIVFKARELGLAGATVTRGIMGFGPDSRIHTAKVLRLALARGTGFDLRAARQHERDLGIAYWDDETPPIDGIEFTLTGADGASALSWAARLNRPAQSVDQRVKMPRWMAEFEAHGGDLRIVEAGIAELDALASESDLVVVAAGTAGVVAPAGLTT